MTTRRSEAKNATEGFVAKKEYAKRLFNLLEGIIDEFDINTGKEKNYAHTGTLSNMISQLEDAVRAAGSAVYKFDTKGDAWTWIDKKLERNEFWSSAAARWVTVPRD